MNSIDETDKLINDQLHELKLLIHERALYHRQLEPIEGTVVGALSCLEKINTMVTLNLDKELLNPLKMILSTHQSETVEYMKDLELQLGVKM